MKLRRVLALCLIVVLAIGCLTSCAEPTAEELISQGDQALVNAPYSVTVDMTFTGDENNEAAEQIASMMNGMEMTLTVDGENLEMSYGMEMDYDSFVVSIDMNMISVDGTIYIANTQAYDGEEETMKMKASVTEDQLEELLGQVGGSTTDITAADFETITMEKVEGVYVITCTDLKAESAAKLNGVFANVAPDTDAVTVSNASVVFEVKDGKYQKATVSCDYSIDIGLGTPVTVGASIAMTYSYEDATVTAPSDAADYEEFDISDILE